MFINPKKKRALAKKKRVGSLYGEKRFLKIALITDTHFGARNDNANFNELFFPIL